MRYLSHVDEYLTLKYKYKYKYSGHKYKYKYKYFKMVLEYYSSTSTSTKYYISAVHYVRGLWFFRKYPVMDIQCTSITASVPWLRNYFRLLQKFL